MASTPIRRLCHWGPILVLGIIKLITWSMVHLLSMWWPPHSSLGAAVHAAMFLGLAACTLYYFLQSLLEGPGFVPLGWKPEREEDCQFLQFCTECNGYKAPRSHHCRKCGYCVKKMDHHCPWINCCVGHANHRHFVLFLLSAVLGCFHASVVLTLGLYAALHRSYYLRAGGAVVSLSLATLLLSLLAVGMAIGVVLAVGALFYLQIRGILRNRTTIEDWIMEKAVARREEQGLPPFVFPYDLGRADNLGFVLMNCTSDGLKWPVRQGCGEYDLTMEQQAQKADKRLRSRLYTATSSYSGRWFPICARPRAALNAPCTDEPRITLQPGDIIRATRQRKHWLFGEKQVSLPPSARGARGWFPRACAVPTDHYQYKND